MEMSTEIFFIAPTFFESFCVLFRAVLLRGRRPGQGLFTVQGKE